MPGQHPPQARAGGAGAGSTYRSPHATEKITWQKVGAAGKGFLVLALCLEVAASIFIATVFFSASYDFHIFENVRRPQPANRPVPSTQPPARARLSELCGKAWCACVRPRGHRNWRACADCKARGDGTRGAVGCCTCGVHSGLLAAACSWRAPGRVVVSSHGLVFSWSVVGGAAAAWGAGPVGAGRVRRAACLLGAEPAGRRHIQHNTRRPGLCIRRRQLQGAQSRASLARVLCGCPALSLSLSLSLFLSLALALPLSLSLSLISHLSPRPGPGRGVYLSICRCVSGVSVSLSICPSVWHLCFLSMHTHAGSAADSTVYAATLPPGLSRCLPALCALCCRWYPQLLLKVGADDEDTCSACEDAGRGALIFLIISFLFQIPATIFSVFRCKSKSNTRKARIGATATSWIAAVCSLVAILWFSEVCFLKLTEVRSAPALHVHVTPRAPACKRVPRWPMARRAEHSALPQTSPPPLLDTLYFCELRWRAWHSPPLILFFLLGSVAVQLCPAPSHNRPVPCMAPPRPPLRAASALRRRLLRLRHRHRHADVCDAGALLHAAHQEGD